MNVNHHFINQSNYLKVISILNNNQEKNINYIKTQGKKIDLLKARLDSFTDAFSNDISFETRINLKNFSFNNKHKESVSKCLIHLLPKSAYFRIECVGCLDFKSKKDFEVEILFPFIPAEIKSRTIEKAFVVL